MQHIIMKRSLTPHRVKITLMCIHTMRVTLLQMAHGLTQWASTIRVINRSKIGQIDPIVETDPGTTRARIAPDDPTIKRYSLAVHYAVRLITPPIVIAQIWSLTAECISNCTQFREPVICARVTNVTLFITLVPYAHGDPLPVFLGIRTLKGTGD